MSKTMLMAIAAAAMLGASAQTGGAGERRVQALPSTIPEAHVYAPISGMTYAVGSNGFMGFFQQTDGKCALTLMLFKRANPDEETPDKSAARVEVSIRPGDNARIGSAEGEALELSCNANAGTVSVAHFRQAVPSQ